MHASLDGGSFFRALARHWVWSIAFVVILAVFFAGLLGKVKTAIVTKVPAVGTLPQF